MRLSYSSLLALLAFSTTLCSQESSSKTENPANAIANVRWKAPTLDDDNLERWMTYVRPTEQELTWRSEIRWHTSLGVAAKEAKALNRPILLWTMNGNPCGET